MKTITNKDIHDFELLCSKDDKSWQFCFGYFQATIGTHEDENLRELSNLLFDKIRLDKQK